MNEITITNTNGVLTVSSLQVAEDFGKQHKHVLETIEELKKGVAENSADPLKGLKFKVSDYFIETTYQHPQNKQRYKCYDITRDGFALLVMGFTGKKALVWKLRYIEAFNSMEKQLININTSIEEIVNRALNKKLKAVVKMLDSAFDERMETVVNNMLDKKLKDIVEILDWKIENTVNKAFDKKFKPFAKSFNKKLRTLAKASDKNSERIIIDTVSKNTLSMVPYFNTMDRIVWTLCNRILQYDETKRTRRKR